MWGTFRRPFKYGVGREIVRGPRLKDFHLFVYNVTSSKLLLCCFFVVLWELFLRWFSYEYRFAVYYRVVSPSYIFILMSFRTVVNGQITILLPGNSYV